MSELLHETYLVPLAVNLTVVPISVSTLILTTVHFLRQKQFLHQWKFILMLVIVVFNNLAIIIYALKYKIVQADILKLTFNEWLPFYIFVYSDYLIPIATLLFAHKYFESVTKLIKVKNALQDSITPLTSYTIMVILGIVWCLNVYLSTLCQTYIVNL